MQDHSERTGRGWRALGVATEWSAGDRVRGRQWIVLGIAVCGYLWLHFFLAGHLIAKTNLNLHATDQAAYLRNAWDSREDALPMRTDAVRNFLWQWLVVHTWLDDGMNDVGWPFEDAELEPHFVAGKWFNVWLTAIFLAGFAVVCARFFPLVATLNLLLLAGFGVLLPRAVWFQPEALFFMLFFASWICCWRLLLRNPLWLYALLGVFTALAYLAKPSTAPLLAVFVLMSSLRLVGALRPGWFGFGEDSAQRWSWRRHLIGLVVLALCHGALVLPRAIYAQRVFHDPFVSLPSYWMWMDKWDEEAMPFTEATDYGRLLHSWPKEQLPSFGKWVREHGWPAFWDRWYRGTSAKLDKFLTPEKQFWKWRLPKGANARLLPDRGVYLGLPLGLLVGLGAVGIFRGRMSGPWGEAMAGVLFGIGAFSIYTLAYGWYDPIGRGDRFMMGLYLPTLFMLMWGCERVKRRVAWPTAKWVYGAVQIYMLACLVTRCVQLALRPVFTG